MRKRVDAHIQRVADGATPSHNLAPQWPEHRSSDVDKRMRVIHQPNPDGTTHFAGLVQQHDYEKTMRALP